MTYKLDVIWTTKLEEGQTLLMFSTGKLRFRQLKAVFVCGEPGGEDSGKLQ